MNISPSRRLLLPLLLCAALLAPAVQAQNGAATTPPNAYMSSPRATVQRFFEAMAAVSAGNETRLGEAIDALYLGEELTREERLNRGTDAAHDLYALLNAAELRLSEIPATLESDDYPLTLEAQGHSVSLRLHRYDDQRWRFASDSVDKQNMAKLLARLAPEDTEAEADDDAAQADFLPELGSPRRTFSFFLEHMNDGDAATAARALDLSALPEAGRAENAHEYAFMLKGVMDRIERVDMTKLPDAPDGRPFVWKRDDAGDVIVAPVTLEDGTRAWKFSADTVMKLEGLWDKYGTQATIAGLTGTQTADLPWRLRIRQELHRLNLPFIFNKPLYIENWQWLGLFLVVVFGMLVSRLIGFVLAAVMQRWFRRASMLINAKHASGFILPIRITLMAWFWLLGLSLLGLPPDIFAWLRIAALVVTACGAVWASYRLIEIIGDYLANLATRSVHRYDDLLVPIVTRSMKIFVVVAAIVVVVNQVTGDATEILAGLGLGGLAFALAAKDVVANIFGSMTILVDRPFELGDWITVGDIDGSVESVGIRSTRIRTFYNSLISVPNSELINSPVDNMGKRRYRRVKSTLSVAYDTPPEKIEAFCEGIRELIRQHPYTRKDYYHVYLNAFSASSLDIMLYTFVETPDWGTELREKHRIFLDILRLAAALGVEFAFPTQTLYMRQEETPEHAAAASPPDAAMQHGRNEAQRIVRDFLGEAGTIPPPVNYNFPQSQTGNEGE